MLIKMINKKRKHNFWFWLLGIIIVILSVYNQNYIKYEHILIQFVITLFGICTAIFFILKNTAEGMYFCKYWSGSVDELKRVSWPNKKEIMQSTIAVLLMVIIGGSILWTVDSILVKLVAWLLQKGSG